MRILLVLILCLFVFSCNEIAEYMGETIGLKPAAEVELIPTLDRIDEQLDSLIINNPIMLQCGPYCTKPCCSK